MLWTKWFLITIRCICKSLIFPQMSLVWDPIYNNDFTCFESRVHYKWFQIPWTSFKLPLPPKCFCELPKNISHILITILNQWPDTIHNFLPFLLSWAACVGSWEPDRVIVFSGNIVLELWRWYIYELKVSIGPIQYIFLLPLKGEGKPIKKQTQEFDKYSLKFQLYYW